MRWGAWRGVRRVKGSFAPERAVDNAGEALVEARQSRAELEEFLIRFAHPAGRSRDPTTEAQNDGEPRGADRNRSAR